MLLKSLYNTIDDAQKEFTVKSVVKQYLTTGALNIALSVSFGYLLCKVI